MGARSHEYGTSSCLMLWLVALLGCFTSERIANAQPVDPSTIPGDHELWEACCVGDCSLQINQTCIGTFLDTRDEHRFEVDTSDSTCQNNPDAYLVIELWHDLAVNKTGDALQHQPSPLLFLARGLTPVVVWDNPALLPTFFPPLSDSSLREYDAGGEATGTFADLTAWRQRRRYHALRVPHNNVTAYGAAPAADRSVNPDLWHVIVTNTGGWIDDESTDVIPRGRLAECECGERSGGYLCEEAVTPVELVRDPRNAAVFTTGRLNLLQPLPEGAWAHYKVQLEAGVTQLLAQLHRQNGSCLLVVKPEGAGEAPRDLPSLVDLQEFADVQSYVDHSAGQARMLQLAASAAPGAPPPAVFVSILSFSGVLLAGEDCDAELELRALPAAAERAQRLCPFDCGEAGTCDLTAVAPGPSIFVDQTFPGEAVDADDGSGGGGSAAQPWLHIESHTVCRCQEGDRLGEASGPWCESKFAEPKLEYGLWTERAVLQPLQWRPHRIEISSAGDAPIRLELQLGERVHGGWSEQGHAVFVARLGSQVPTITDNDYLFVSRGGPGGELEFVIAREDLLEESEVTVAVYNAGLVPDASGPPGTLAVAPGRSLDVHYRVRVTEALPGKPLSRAELVGIVIGCAAFMLIVLVLCIVICHQCRASLQGPEVELLPIGPRAVPAMSAGAIAELDSFTFDEQSLAAKGVTERQLRHASSSSAIVAPGDAATPLSCHVCKCEYVVGDRLRQLPCQHIFHKACIDEWIGRYHATCPICRKNLLGSHKSPRIPSRMLASSGRAESANVSARRHLSGGYSGNGYTDSMRSASSGGFDGDGPRFGTGSALPPLSAPSPRHPRPRNSDEPLVLELICTALCGQGGHYNAPSGHSAVLSLHGAGLLPRASSASASPERSPTPVQRVNSGARPPSPHGVGLSPRSAAGWAHDSGPEVIHHDLLRVGGDTDGMPATAVDFVDTDSGRAASALASTAGDGGETFRNTAHSMSRSSSPALGEAPRGPLPVAVVHNHVPLPPAADYRGFVSEPGRPGLTSYMTAFPAPEGNAGGSSDVGIGMLGQSSMLPGEGPLPGHGNVGVPGSGSPLGGPAVGNPALRGPSRGLTPRAAAPSQDSLLHSDGGGDSISREIDVEEDEGAGLTQDLGPGPAYMYMHAVRDNGLGEPVAGGWPSIASTVSPLDTAAAGGGPSIASTITPAQSRDGASASRTQDTDDHFSLPVIGAAAWANRGMVSGRGASPGFLAILDDELQQRGEAATQDEAPRPEQLDSHERERR